MLFHGGSVFPKFFFNYRSHDKGNFSFFVVRCILVENLEKQFQHSYDKCFCLYVFYYVCPILLEFSRKILTPTPTLNGIVRDSSSKKF